MEHQIYCDGIGRISVIEGMVRLDLYSYSPTETDAGGQPRPVLSHRIVMGMDGFLRSSEKVVEAVKLISQARKPQAAQAQAPQAPMPQAPRQQAAPPPAPPAPPAPQPQTQPAPQPTPAPSKPPFP